MRIRADDIVVNPTLREVAPGQWRIARREECSCVTCWFNNRVRDAWLVFRGRLDTVEYAERTP